MRNYMRKNGHKYLHHRTTVHDCETCDGVYRMTTRARHYKSKKHLKAVESIVVKRIDVPYINEFHYNPKIHIKI